MNYFLQYYKFYIILPRLTESPLRVLYFVS